MGCCQMVQQTGGKNGVTEAIVGNEQNFHLGVLVAAMAGRFVKDCWLYAQAIVLPTGCTYLTYLAMVDMATNQYSILENRGVLALGGNDVHGFLQNLVTNDIDPVSKSVAVYTALLSPQGKYLHDFFVVPQGGRLLLDCERARKDDLIKRLSLYRLRADVDISDLSDSLAVSAAFGPDARTMLKLPADQDGVVMINDGAAFSDPRLPAAGARIIAANGDSILSDMGFAHVGMAEYDLFRLQLALPESGADLIVDKTIALEANLDFLNGVDFSKGCFVGQEVTARTKYRGLARKRLLPVTFAGGILPAGEDITADGKSVGEVRSSSNGHGLALMRLDRLAEAQDAGHPLNVGDMPVTVKFPAWLKIEASEP